MEPHLFDSNGRYWSLLECSTYEELEIEPEFSNYFLNMLMKYNRYDQIIEFKKKGYLIGRRRLARYVAFNENIDLLNQLTDVYGNDFCFSQNTPNLVNNIEVLDWLVRHSNLYDDKYQSDFIIRMDNKIYDFDILVWYHKLVNFAKDNLPNYERWSELNKNNWKFINKEGKIQPTNKLLFVIQDVKKLTWLTENVENADDYKHDFWKIAFRRGSMELLDHLLQRYPDTTFTITNLSVERAFQNANFEFLRRINQMAYYPETDSWKFDIDFSKLSVYILHKNNDKTTIRQLCEWLLEFHAIFDAKIMNPAVIIHRLSMLGYLQSLIWFYQLYLDGKTEFGIYSDAVNLASRSGHIDILNWWYELCETTHFEFVYTSVAMYFFIDCDQISVLSWWFQRHCDDKLELMYDNSVSSIFRKTNYCAIVDKWMEMNINFGIKFKYSDDIDKLSEFGNIAGLNKWIELSQLYKYPLIYTCDAIDKAANTEVLDWWVWAHQEYGIELKYSDDSTATNKLSILNWWKKMDSDFPMEHCKKLEELVKEDNPIYVLEWWIASGKLDSIDIVKMDETINTSTAQLKSWWEKRKETIQKNDDSMMQLPPF